MSRFLLALTALSLPAVAGAQEPAREGTVPFTWRDRVAPGNWLRVYNYNGPVEAVEVSGDMALVEGDHGGYSRSRSRSWEEARFEVLRDGNDVIVCVLPESRGVCRREGISTRSSRGSDRPSSASVRVQVPRGVHLEAWSGNGEVQVRDVSAEVEAWSGNGAVTVTGSGGPVRVFSGNGAVEVATARGPVSARSGNGRVWVQMRELGTRDDMEFHTGNGQIIVELPRDFAGIIDASTMNGHIESDFPVTVEGRFSVRRLSGRVGRGAGSDQRIKLWTGNGNLQLREIGSTTPPRRR